MKKRTIKISQKSIDHNYGRGNDDVAGDALIYCLRQVEDYLGQITCDFEYDHSHVNPYFYTLNFIIESSELQFQDITKRIKLLKLDML